MIGQIRVRARKRFHLFFFVKYRKYIRKVEFRVCILRVFCNITCEKPFRNLVYTCWYQTFCEFFFALKIKRLLSKIPKLSKIYLYFQKWYPKMYGTDECLILVESAQPSLLGCVSVSKTLFSRYISNKHAVQHSTVFYQMIRSRPFSSLTPGIIP